MYIYRMSSFLFQGISLKVSMTGFWACFLPYHTEEVNHCNTIIVS